MVEVSATAGEEAVTGSARITVGSADGPGEAAAREVCSLGGFDSSVTGCARRTLAGEGRPAAGETRFLSGSAFLLRQDAAWGG